MPSPAKMRFDAYHKWLGIPPSEQPANHYKLLGLAAYEGDAEVIAAAADRQMAHVKAFSTGQHAAESQSLLNELARARVTLLNARQKAAYDDRLRRSFTKDVPRAAPLVGRGDAVVDDEESRSDSVSPHLQFQLPQNPHSLPPARIFRRRRKGLPVHIIFTGAALSGAAIIFAYNQLNGSGNQGTVTSSSPSVLPLSRPSAGVHRANPTLQSGAGPGDSREALGALKPQDPVGSGANESLVGVVGETYPDLELPLQEQPADEEPVQSGSTQEFDLDLKSRRQKLELANVSATQFRILSLNGCETPYVIDPKNGLLDETNNVTISINGVREVVIELELRRNSSSDASILADYYAINDEGSKVPFALAKIGAICGDISKQGRLAISSLNAMVDEKTRLQLWVSAPIIKPLADVGTAKTRIMELNVLIADQQAVVEALEADLDVAETLEELAIDLDQDCAIEITSGD